MRCLSCAHICVKETDTVTNLEFDIKGETDEEELLQAESKHDVTAEKEEQTPASAKIKFENKIFRGTKRPNYQPETASAVLIRLRLKLQPRVQFTNVASQYQLKLWDKHDVTVRPAINYNYLCGDGM